ncbi:hypothetical protein [Streptomyces sp. MNU77]|uniref:hypothetical protein n=1 Tax=Streptomyces sp. MNU77 TaxID=1573406 RepID=UPI00117DBF56|nr:hypothetical protein [Streptomyces sp. MNU77]
MVEDRVQGGRTVRLVEGGARLLLVEVGQRLPAGGCGGPLAGCGLAGAEQGLVRIGHVVVAEVIDGAAVGRHPGVEGIEGPCAEEVSDRLALFLDGPEPGRGRPDAARGRLRCGTHLSVGLVRGADRLLRGGGIVDGEGPLRGVPVGDLLVGDVVGGDFRVYGHPVRAVEVLPRPPRQLAGVGAHGFVGEVAGSISEDVADSGFHGVQGCSVEVGLPCPVEVLVAQDTEPHRGRPGRLGRLAQGRYEVGDPAATAQGVNGDQALLFPLAGEVEQAPPGGPVAADGAAKDASGQLVPQPGVKGSRQGRADGVGQDGGAVGGHGLSPSAGGTVREGSGGRGAGAGQPVAETVDVPEVRPGPGGVICRILAGPEDGDVEGCEQQRAACRAEAAQQALWRAGPHVTRPRLSRRSRTG